MGQRSSRPDAPPPPKPCPNPASIERSFPAAQQPLPWQAPPTIPANTASRPPGDENAVSCDFDQVADITAAGGDTPKDLQSQTPLGDEGMRTMLSSLLSLFNLPSSSTSWRPSRSRPTSGASAGSRRGRVSPIPSELASGSCPPPTSRSNEPATMMEASSQPKRMTPPSRRRPTAPGGPLSASAPPPSSPPQSASLRLSSISPSSEPHAQSAPVCMSLYSASHACGSQGHVQSWEAGLYTPASSPKSALSSRPESAVSSTWSRPPSSLGSRECTPYDLDGASLCHSRPNSGVSRPPAHCDEDAAWRCTPSRPTSGVSRHPADEDAAWRCASSRPPSGLPSARSQRGGVGSGGWHVQVVIQQEVVGI